MLLGFTSLTVRDVYMSAIEPIFAPNVSEEFRQTPGRAVYTASRCYSCRRPEGSANFCFQGGKHLGPCHRTQSAEVCRTSGQVIQAQSFELKPTEQLMRACPAVRLETNSREPNQQSLLLAPERQKSALRKERRRVRLCITLHSEVAINPRARRPREAVPEARLRYSGKQPRPVDRIEMSVRMLNP